MITKRITYTDYNGNERTEDFSFHINKAEAVELETSVDGGLSELIKKIIKEENKGALVKEFQKVIKLSYGKKSPDGRSFMKSDEITDSFIRTEAYPILFMELSTDAKSAADFINGVLSDVKPNK